MEARICQLEARLALEVKEHENAIEMRDAEIARLKMALDEQLVEYRDLLDVKIALDMEIAAYRKLLESEETRYANEYFLLIIFYNVCNSYMIILCTVLIVIMVYCMLRNFLFQIEHFFCL